MIPSPLPSPPPFPQLMKTALAKKLRKSRKAPAAAPQESIRTRKIGQLKLTNVPMLEVLRFICSNAGLRQKVEDYAVTILPAGGNDVDLYQRTFSVPRFQSALRTTVGDGGGEVSDDPFGGGGESLSGLKPMPSIRSLLQKSGISFPEGATAFLVNGNSSLVVRNTSGNLGPDRTAH